MTYPGCIIQMYFFTVFSELGDILLSLMSCDWFVTIDQFMTIKVHASFQIMVFSRYMLQEQDCGMIRQLYFQYFFFKESSYYSTQWLYQFTVPLIALGLPRWCSGKKSACQCRRCKRHGFNPWIGKIPWRRKWKPTPVFLPGKSLLDRGVLQATVHGVPKSRT